MCGFAQGVKVELFLEVLAISIEGNCKSFHRTIVKANEKNKVGVAGLFRDPEEPPFLKFCSDLTFSSQFNVCIKSKLFILSGRPDSPSCYRICLDFWPLYELRALLHSPSTLRGRLERWSPARKTTEWNPALHAVLRFAAVSGPLTMRFGI